MRDGAVLILIWQAQLMGTGGPDWLHEVKYDGYRLRLERDGDRVRLITRGGHNESSRYPWIVEAALSNRHQQFVLDGEAVVAGQERAEIKVTTGQCDHPVA